jgi:NitT/TauT family transport system permease protein
MKLKLNPAFLVLLSGLALWQAAGAWSGLIADVIGTPVTVVGQLMAVLATPITWFHIGVTAIELALGLALAISAGLILSLGLGTEERVHRVLEPFLVIGNTVPKIILLPAFLMLFGTGYASKVAFGGLHGMLPIAIIVSNGARKILAGSQVRAAITLNATKGQIVRHILFPAVLPYLVTALRLSVSLTLLGVVLGEMYVARAGLGFMLMRWYGELQIPKMLSVVILIGALASALDFVFRRVEVRVWRNHGFRQ